MIRVMSVKLSVAMLSGALSVTGSRNVTTTQPLYCPLLSTREGSSHTTSHNSRSIQVTIGWDLSTTLHFLVISTFLLNNIKVPANL